MTSVMPVGSSWSGALARLATVVLACWLGAAASAAPALSAAEWQAIQQVIAAQRAAIVAGDADKAFAYASPGIQQQFGDAATFLAMVDAAYAALESARYVEFLEGAVIDGIVVQPLRLIDADNTVRVALYTMEKQADGRWRISSCRIAPSTVRAAQGPQSKPTRTGIFAARPSRPAASA
jgi:hypothetical protein